MSDAVRERFRGCLLGGAVGDALGAPVEFMSHAEIVRRFGANGIRDYAPAYGMSGAITDDTQMTLFTAEGLLRAHVRGCMRGLTTYAGVTDHAYLRWLETQGVKSPLEIGRDGWLWGIKALHHRHAPGNTCMSSLKAKRTFGEPALNDSKAAVASCAWRQSDCSVALAACGAPSSLLQYWRRHDCYDGIANCGVMLRVQPLVTGLATCLRERMREVTPCKLENDQQNNSAGSWLTRNGRMCGPLIRQMRVENRESRQFAHPMIKCRHRNFSRHPLENTAIGSVT